jgi:hypothetical protein
MRFYSAGNMYLSSIQQGIQAAHCVGEMALEHTGNKMFEDWLSIHKTLICVNGGNNASLLDLYNLFTEANNPGYPVAHFREDEQSMAGMLTTVGIIVPEKIYEIDPADANTWAGLSEWEVRLALALKRLPLAR